jgi:uncharacterized protein (DUF58 family)
MISSQHNFMARLISWIESHWAIPAYGGWVLIGIAISFFGAATNTMSGWLYVLSGMLLSLLGINFISSIANLKHLKIERSSIPHIHAGDELALEILINNPRKKSKNLIEIIDHIPINLGTVTNFVVEQINPQGRQIIYRRKVTPNNKQKNYFPIEVIPPYSKVALTIYLQSQSRGIYHWHDLALKSAAPFGLFSCRRQHQVESRAVIYPQILPLHSCPLIDDIGNQEARKKYSKKTYQNSTEGITKSLRQYRYGDAMRLIHWRSSARLGELQVRELETITGGEEIIICLDNSSGWQENLFEEAVKTVASMYFYASRQQLPVNVWIGNIGIIHGSQVILETLAGVTPGEIMTEEIPDLPLVWLSHNSNYLDSLPDGSRYFLFPDEEAMGGISSNLSCQGVVYDADISLVNQLQKPV